MRPFRLLLDPTATDGGAAPAAPANPAAAPAGQPGNPAAPVINYNIGAPANPAAPAGNPAPAIPPVPSGQTVTIPYEQLQAFTNVQARLAQLEADQRARDETHQREMQNEMLRRGQAEEALRLAREQSAQQLQAEQARLAEERSRSQNYAIEVRVAEALAPHQFSSPVARRAIEAEVRQQLIADPQGNTFNVRTPTFQTPEQVVAAIIANPDYGPFLAPRGVAGTQGAPAAQTPAAPPAANPAPAGPTVDAMGRPINPETGRPLPLGQALVQERQSRLAAMSQSSEVRFDPSRPMGLGAGSLVPRVG